MKDFTYMNDGFNLMSADCEWLRKTGLRETRWILDREWFAKRFDKKSFIEWIHE